MKTREKSGKTKKNDEIRFLMNVFRIAQDVKILMIKVIA